jgi:multidrug resistance protein MdtO
MSSAASLPIGLLHPVRFLKEELAPYPGRINLVLRCLLGSAVVIVTSLTLEVPILMLSLITVMAVTQANVVVVRLVGIVAILGTTLAIGTTILLFKFTFDYPLMRILAASALFFGSVYMMRIAKVGVVFFFVAIVVIFAQTFVDQTDNAELLVRLVLWIWVALVYPTVLTLLINTLFLPVEPQLQLKAEIHRQFQAIDACLAYLLGSPGTPSPITLPAVQKGALTLQKLLKFATMRDKGYRAEQARHLATIATVSRLYYAASELPLTPISPAPELVDALTDLREACDALDSAIASGQPFLLPEPSTSKRRDIAIAPIAEMQTALEALADYETHPSPSPAPSIKKSIIVDDAFTNPVYVQFSLKTLLAVLVTYVFYNAADWQGVHTVMLSCLIIAQSSLGASARKGILRIVGAGIGSVLALFMMVFVVPHLETVVGVLMMTLPVVALATWMMAGSERISYAGFQIVVTFALALLDNFSPAINLTEVRDRIIGVLLGVGVSTLIQATIWPEGEGNNLRRSLADLLQAIGKLLQPIHKEIAPAASVALAQQQLAVLAKLADCESMLARVALEPSGRESQQEELTLGAQTVLAQARAVMLAAIALQGELDAQLEPLPVEVREAVFSIQDQAASALDRYATELRGNACQPPAPIPLDTLERSFASSLTAVPETRKSAILNSVENVVRQLANLPSWGASVPTPPDFDLVHNYG